MISSLQLAKICGVSQGTVDRALHGRTGIAPATREKILEAAQQHGYVPNPAARELMTGRNRICGVILPVNAGVFFMDLVEELRQALKRRGLSLLIAPAADARETLEALQDFASRRVQGIALVPPSDDFQVPKGIANACPIVSLVSPCVGEKVCYVASEETQTGYDGAAFLWSLGHRRIAYLTSLRQARAITERREGYLRFMREKGAQAQIVVPATADAVLRLMEQSAPTALFCLNDWLALKTLRTLESHGIKVPGEVSVLGVDDSPTFNALFEGMSTMSYPDAAIAEAAAAILAGERETVGPLPKLEIRRRRTVGNV